jgi:uncharacterized protein YyaL (SSP411 family)
MRFFAWCWFTLTVVCQTAIAGPAWRDWDDLVFAQAQREQRFVLLNLEAVWCHWCHVMERETYQDARVLELLQRRFLTVKADQDARPDLSRRYEDYGWPATIIFGPDGREIVKRRGYLNARAMRSLLQAVIDDPSPVDYRDAPPQQFSAEATLGAPLSTELLARYRDTHDAARGGLNRQPHKYLHADTVEFGLFRTGLADQAAARMARQTLDGALRLIDPAWGGAYQYSTHGDWSHPHYEKIMSTQADNLRIFSHAFARFGTPSYRRAAESVWQYLDRFLRAPDGGFYTSQDADLIKGQHAEDYFALDDAARRRRGVPAIDTHRYARENGWVITALCDYYAATQDQTALTAAIAAARWVQRERGLAGGGYRHDAADRGGPFLDDSVAMGRALLALYSVTGEREWLSAAAAAANFITTRFASAQAGYRSAVEPRAIVHVDENIALARFANLLHRYTGKAEFAAMAAHAMRYLATPAVALRRRTEPGILLAAEEIAGEPLHFTIVGAKDDPAARELFGAALRYPAVYRRLEWWDQREGPLPNADVTYPELARAAAFVCSERVCSLPAFSATQVTERALALGNR